MTVRQTAGWQQLGEFAPEFAHLNDDILFGEVWNRTDKLSLKQRSMITVTALMAQGLTDTSFAHHLQNAKNNGVTGTEIAELITHAAFYAGWPKAWAAFRLAKDIWTENDPKADYQETIQFPIGKPNDAYAQYLDGQSWLAPLGGGLSNVTFEPGCRNHWHIHQAAEGGGQLLFCVGGCGYYQEWGKDPIEMNPGDSIVIPANAKHWHGAAPDSWFSHLAMELPGTETGTIWEDPVDPADYETLK